MREGVFKLEAPFEPRGDQPRAIEQLTERALAGDPHQTLLGVTGSGKTLTIANVVARLNRPTLVIAPNKTLAAQLYTEFASFFPSNAVRYFVSYYDYYQPEAYVPSTDTFIEKDSSINDEIDKMRHSATKALLERNDVLIVASVSCIYGLGSPEKYFEMLVFDTREPEMMQPPDTIESIAEFDPLRGRVLRPLSRVAIYPASHYVTTRDRLKEAVASIEQELAGRLVELRGEGKLVEAQRLEQRTRFDLEMLAEMGFCNGIENYSRHLDGRRPGEPPLRPWPPPPARRGAGARQCAGRGARKQGPAQHRLARTDR